MEYQGPSRGGSAIHSLLDSLPEPLLTNILGRDAPLRRLCQLRTVSKSFYSAISRVEHVSCFLDKADAIEGMCLLRFLQGTERVTSLKIRSSAQPSSSYGSMLLAAALGAASSLKSFTLSESTMDVAESEEMGHHLFKSLSHLPQLESLYISCNGLFLQSKLHSRHLLKKVRSLELSWSSISDDGLATLLKACPSLQHLKLSSLGGLSRPRIDCCTLLSLDWSDVTHELLEKIHVKAPLLRSLVIPPSTEANIYAPDIETLETEFLGRLVGPPFAKLRTLQIGGMDWTMDQFLGMLGACTAAKVVKLDIDSWEAVARPVALSKILSLLKDVQELSLSGPMIDLCLMLPETEPEPLLQRLEKVNLNGYDLSEKELFLGLQLVRISPTLKELFIKAEASEAIPKAQVAGLLKIQQHNLNLRLRVE